MRCFEHVGRFLRDEAHKMQETLAAAITAVAIELPKRAKSNSPILGVRRYLPLTDLMKPSGPEAARLYA